MPKKFADGETRGWLAEYDQGLSAKEIAAKRKIDIRVVNRALDRLILERESHLAKFQLVKEALLRHNQKLSALLKTLPVETVPPDLTQAPLPWMPDRLGNAEEAIARESEARPRLTSEEKEWTLLRQHLKHDRLWRLITNWERANMDLRLALIKAQLEVVNQLEQHIKLSTHEEEQSPPFISLRDTGELFFRSAFRQPIVSDEGLSGLITVASDGSVRDDKSLLVFAPGIGAKMKSALITAYGGFLKSNAILDVQSASVSLDTAEKKLTDRIDDLLQIGLISGSCKVCSNLSL